MENLKGRFTIVAYNSVGIAYSWDTTIDSVTDKGSTIEVIHKPKGKRTKYKHTYTKDQELRIYKGWLKLDMMNDVMISFDDNAFNKLKEIKQEPVLIHA